MVKSPTKRLTGGLLRMIASTVRPTVPPLRVFIPLFYSIMSKGTIFFFFTEMAFNDATIVLKMLKHISFM